MASLGRRRGVPVSRERGVMAASDCYIVHEIYNGENAQDQFEYELEQALEAQYKYIIIEPTRIGDETARWITVGNCLHKTAVLSGAACLLTPLSLPIEYTRYVALPAGALSVACAALYGISWQFDPCCKYQVEYDSQKLSRLPLHTLTSSTPVVLVRRDDIHRKRLHNTIALAALAYCAKKIYELYALPAEISQVAQVEQGGSLSTMERVTGAGMLPLVFASFGVLLLYRILLRLRPGAALHDAVVVITGASSGLGKECAQVFHAAGARLVLCGRDAARLQQVAQELKASSAETHCQTRTPRTVVFDLADTDTVERAAEEILKCYGQVDVLINNAGISYRGNILDTHLSVQRDVMETNYFGPIAFTQALLPSMVRRRSGHIVVISSVQGKIAIPYRSAYAASKHATQAYFDCLRAEIERYGIPVTVISPGYIRTNLSVNAVTGDGSKHGVLDKATATGSDPRDVAQAVLKAVRQRSKDVVLAGPLPSLAIYIRTLWPALFFKLMASRARKEQKLKDE
ncbi:hypothetical protein Q5P01_017593 [Channa striata]|uniref:Dehydrogenase/reductase SDR family member 7B n=1 Tax=Channa striata TaxID=64152 RepID=A0AA88SBS4_CHASR|nr:hypothetical protein Q5P01_017593 [Channa striata]